MSRRGQSQAIVPRNVARHVLSNCAVAGHESQTLHCRVVPRAWRETFCEKRVYAGVKEDAPAGARTVIVFHDLLRVHDVVAVHPNVVKEVGEPLLAGRGV